MKRKRNKNREQMAGNPNDTPFDVWLASVPPGRKGGMSRRGRGGGFANHATNAAPMGMDELRHYFVGLSVEKLAACWVACVVDAVVMAKIDKQMEYVPADVCRALIVVAVRLHGVRAPEVVLKGLRDDLGRGVGTGIGSGVGPKR